MTPNELSTAPQPEQALVQEVLPSPEQMSPEQVAAEVSHRLTTITGLRQRFIASRAPAGPNAQKAAA